MKIKVIYVLLIEPILVFESREITFKPYCSFAMIGLSEMKAKSLRFTVNGRGTMRARKTAISKTRRRKTYIKVMNCQLLPCTEGFMVRSLTEAMKAVHLLVRPQRHPAGPVDGTEQNEMTEFVKMTYETVVESHFAIISRGNTSRGGLFTLDKRGVGCDWRASMAAGSRVNKDQQGPTR